MSTDPDRLDRGGSGVWQILDKDAEHTYVPSGDPDLEGLLKSGVPQQIPRGSVDDVFRGMYFIGVGNIIDRTAHQTGFRHVVLGSGQSLFEFDIWQDPEGALRKKVLRIESEREGGVPADRHDFTLDESGELYLGRTEGEAVDGK